MTVLRFDFQRQCVVHALASGPGLILNVGCKEDPANLKALDPERVRNCDLTDRDADYEGRVNPIDRRFDCTAGDWPFKDHVAALVVLGDILEHLSATEIRRTLREARRVSEALCITVPQDEHDTTCDEYADRFPRGNKHRTIVTEPLLRAALKDAGWTVGDWQRVDYGLWPLGHFVKAH